jgi:copper ion binding protein
VVQLKIWRKRMTKVTYEIPNISCKHCIHTIKMELGELEGVSNVDADLETKTITVSFDDPADAEKIEATLSEINYPVQK